MTTLKRLFEVLTAAPSKLLLAEARGILSSCCAGYLGRGQRLVVQHRWALLLAQNDSPWFWRVYFTPGFPFSKAGFTQVVSS